MTEEARENSEENGRYLQMPVTELGATTQLLNYRGALSEHRWSRQTGGIAPDGTKEGSAIA